MLYFLNCSLRKMCPKYGVFSGLDFPILGLNTEILRSKSLFIFNTNMEKSRSEQIPYFNTFHAVVESEHVFRELNQTSALTIFAKKLLISSLVFIDGLPAMAPT